MLDHLKSHLKGKVAILGIGNTMRSDDGAGSALASRIKGRVPYTVFDAGTTPENYLGSIIRDKPDNIIIIDAADFGGKAGEFREIEASDVKTVNLFSTHDASLTLTINYLQENTKKDIIMLIIQPKSVTFGDRLSPEVYEAIKKLEGWFCGTYNQEG